MTRLSDYAQGTTLMADEPGEQMPPMSIVDYAAIDSGVPTPPYVLSMLGPDHLSNWDSSDMDAYREKRGRWQQAIVRYLDPLYPGLASPWSPRRSTPRCRSGNISTRPTAPSMGSRRRRRARSAHPARSPRTVVPGLYLASAYAGFGGYSGVVQSAGACADMILREG